MAPEESRSNGVDCSGIADGKADPELLGDANRALGKPGGVPGESNGSDDPDRCLCSDPGVETGSGDAAGEVAVSDVGYESVDTGIRGPDSADQVEGTVGPVVEAGIDQGETRERNEVGLGEEIGGGTGINGSEMVEDGTDSSAEVPVSESLPLDDLASITAVNGKDAGALGANGHLESCRGDACSVVREVGLDGSLVESVDGPELSDISAVNVESGSTSDISSAVEGLGSELNEEEVRTGGEEVGGPDFTDKSLIDVGGGSNNSISNCAEDVREEVGEEGKCPGVEQVKTEASHFPDDSAEDGCENTVTSGKEEPLEGLLEEDRRGVDGVKTEEPDFIDNLTLDVEGGSGNNLLIPSVDLQVELQKEEGHTRREEAAIEAPDFPDSGMDVEDGNGNNLSCTMVAVQVQLQEEDAQVQLRYEEADHTSGEPIEIVLLHDETLDAVTTEDEAMGLSDTGNRGIEGCVFGDLHTQNEFAPCLVEAEETPSCVMESGDLEVEKGENVAVDGENEISVKKETCIHDVVLSGRLDLTAPIQETAGASDFSEEHTEHCPCPQTQNVAPPSSAEAEEIAPRDMKSQDPLNEKGETVSVDGEDDLLVEKETCAHDTVLSRSLDLMANEGETNCVSAITGKESMGSTYDLQMQNGVELNPVKAEETTFCDMKSGETETENGENVAVDDEDQVLVEKEMFTPDTVFAGRLDLVDPERLTTGVSNVSENDIEGCPSDPQIQNGVVEPKTLEAEKTTARDMNSSDSESDKGKIVAADDDGEILVEKETCTHDSVLSGKGNLIVDEGKSTSVSSISEQHIEGRGCDLQMQTRVEPSSLEAEETTYCRMKFGDSENDQGESMTVDPEDQTVVEKETCTHDSVLSEIDGDSNYAVEVRHDVQREICLEEENATSLDNQNRSKIEEGDGKSVSKEDDVVEAMNQNGVPPPTTEDPVDEGKSTSVSNIGEKHIEGRSCDLQTQTRVEPSSLEAEESTYCCMKSGDSENKQGESMTVDPEDRTVVEKETCTHGSVLSEIDGDSNYAVEVRHDVQRAICLEEENATSLDNQDRSKIEDGDGKPIFKEDDVVEAMNQNGVAPPATEDPVVLGSDSRFYMIRIPRMQEENLSSQIMHFEALLIERTQKRDSIRMKIREIMTSFEEHKKNINDARNNERAAREAFYAKQQEVNMIHSTADKIELANSIDNVDDKMQYLSHRMQHETISLKEEKQLMREIKELKQKRDHLSKLTPETEMQKAFEQKDQIEDNLKRLRPELEHLRKELLQYEAKTKDARKKYDDEYKRVEDLRRQYKVADDLRQEAFSEMKTLRKQLYEKNKHFYKYKDDMRAAVTYSLSGDKEALRKLCDNQVEGFMELWNKNNEFRNEYVKANQNSTIRRFRTLDGRSLGADEQPATFPNSTGRKLESTIEAPSTSYSDLSTRKQEKLFQLSEPETVSETSIDVGNGKKTVGLKKLTEKDLRNPTALPISIVEAKAYQDETEKEKQRAADAELKRLADELASKEKLEKEKEAAELKEKIRLEQIAKAREAEERKKRKAEKAKAAAEIRARKETELKEKKRAKKERQKEKKAARVTDLADGASITDQHDTDLLPLESAEVPETNVAPAAKRPSKTPQPVKQPFKKINPLPTPLRNKNRRKMQTWMWAAFGVAIVSILFLVGSHVSFFRTSPRQYGF